MGTVKTTTVKVTQDRKVYRLFWPSGIATHVATRFDGDRNREKLPKQPNQALPYTNISSHPFLHLSIEHILDTWVFDKIIASGERQLWLATWGNYDVTIVVSLTKNKLIVVHSAYVKPKPGYGKNK